MITPIEYIVLQSGTKTANKLLDLLPKDEIHENLRNIIAVQYVILDSIIENKHMDISNALNYMNAHYHILDQVVKIQNNFIVNRQM